jgi:hypothetical protein
MAIATVLHKNRSACFLGPSAKCTNLVSDLQDCEGRRSEHWHETFDVLASEFAAMAKGASRRMADTQNCVPIIKLLFWQPIAKDNRNDRAPFSQNRAFSS